MKFRNFLAATTAIAITMPGLALAEDLTLYSNWPRERLEVLRQAFAEVHPEVNLQYFRAGNAALATIFATEMEQGVGRADYITSDVDFVEVWKEAGYLEANVPAGVADLLEDSIDPDGYWIPLDFSPYVMVYNTNFVSEDEAPTSWTDLIDPKWSGRIGFADPRLAAGAQIPMRYWTENLAESVGAPFGWEFVEAFANQDLTLTTGHPQLADFVVTGEVWIAASIGIANLKVPYENGEPIRIVWPEEGSPGNIIAGAIVRDAPNPEAAVKLHEFLASTEGQRVIGDDLGLVPSTTAVDFAAPDGRTLDEIERHRVTIPEELREGNTQRFIGYIEGN